MIRRLVPFVTMLFIIFVTGCGGASGFVPPTLPDAGTVGEIGNVQKDSSTYQGQIVQEKFLVYNCNNSSKRSDSLTEVQTIGRNVELSVGIEAGIRAAVEAAIESAYTTEVTNAIQRGRAIEMSADPNKTMEYTVEWAPVVWKGSVPLKLQSGESIVEYTYSRIQFGEVVEIVDRSNDYCDGQLPPASPEMFPTQTRENEVVSPTKESPSEPSDFSATDIDSLIGANNWQCLPGRANGISILNLPPDFEVRYPFIRIDAGSVQYYPGNRVPDTTLATGWLAAELPNSTCTTQTRPIAREEVDALLGANNWKCLNDFPNGISIWNVPQNFAVQYPLGSVDKLDNRYFLGDMVPAGDLATGWLQNDISRDECR